MYTLAHKGRTIRKVMEGGVAHFQRVRLFFQNFLLVSIFFFIIPCSNFIFFQKIVGEGGGGGEKGHKKGVKKNFPD